MSPPIETLPLWPEEPERYVTPRGEPLSIEAPMGPGPVWEGTPDRLCGEHLPGNGRAWCLDCSEWCYPDIPCIRCHPAVIALRESGEL